MADANERPAPAEKAPRRLQPTLISGAIPRSSPDPSESDSPPPFPTLPEGSGSKSFFDYLLQRYPPNEDVEDALPIFGESGSEFEYDSETRQEIEDEMRGAPGPLELAEEEFNAIVDEHIADRETLFMTTRLPKQQHKAFAIWSEGNNNPDVIENYSQELEYFEQRLRAEREALAGAHHSTRRDLLDACPCMNITISAICLKKWQLSIVKQNEAPKKIAPPPRDTKAAKARVHANGDESLDSDSGSDSGSVWMDEDEEEKRDDPEIDAGPDHLQERAGPGKLSETEECVISPDESRKRSSSAFRNGPFRDSSSSDESLDQFMIDEHEHVELATKRRRMKGTNPDETDLASSAIPLQGLMPGQDLPLPSTEGPADVEMETRIDTANRPQYRTHQSLNPNSGDIDENDDALNAFVEVSSIMWESIEQNGDRFYLLAKALSCLTKSRAEQFSKFLAESLPFIYQDIARDALIAISEDESAIEAMNPEQSHLAMLLATLFISWVNKLRIPDEAIPTEQVKIALAVVTEDTGEDGFTPFWDSLNDLLEGYLRWHSLPREVQSKKKKIEPRRQRRTMKLISKRITMNRAQEEGQQRQDLQDAAKRALLDSRLTEGIAFSNITDYPVSFRDPIIYLDPHISKFIKNHQLLGIQFLFREIAENKEPEGCLLAHTMGLGKTMQV